jgi:hypothetical protein
VVRLEGRLTAGQHRANENVAIKIFLLAPDLFGGGRRE